MQTRDHHESAAGRKAAIVIVVAGALILGAYLTRGFGLFPAPKEAEAEKPLFTRQGDRIVVPEGSMLRDRIAIAAVPAQSVNAKMVLPGIVESDPSRTAAVLPPLGGRIVAIRIALGDRVAKGQVVATIQSGDLAQAYDDDDKARDTFELTEKNLKRQQEQSKFGAISARDLDQAVSDHAQATAEYARTQARLQAIGAVAKGAKRGAVLEVRAPVAGSVTALNIATGNVINDPTQPIMTIADLSTVWVTAMVPEKDVAAVAKDQDADVSFSAYPDKPLHGKVLFVSDVLEPDTRREKLRIAFANPSFALKPNMFATVTLAGKAAARVIVPTSALLMNNDRTSVFVAVAPWTFERRYVETQLEEGPNVAIASGLNAGDTVIVKGGILLND